MRPSAPPPDQRSAPDPARRSPLRRRALPMAIVAAACGAGAWVWMSAAGDPRASIAGARAPMAIAGTGAGAGLAAAIRPPPPVERPVETRVLDRDDLAAYIAPGDPEPSGAEVIVALQDAGVRGGLAAFNPPGTRPPLEGLAVPADFPLPAGYVRHHQFTDAGEPIEPILMFAPGAVLRDRAGRPLALPEDGVVPPHLAPPGLPIRRVRIPRS